MPKARISVFSSGLHPVLPGRHDVTYSLAGSATSSRSNRSDRAGEKSPLPPQGETINRTAVQKTFWLASRPLYSDFILKKLDRCESRLFCCLPTILQLGREPTEIANCRATPVNSSRYLET